MLSTKYNAWLIQDTLSEQIKLSITFSDSESLQSRHVHCDAQPRPVQRHRQGPITPQGELVIREQAVTQRVGVPV